MNDSSRQTDAELVRRAQTSLSGDLRAFDELVARHQEKILANCRYLTRSPDNAEDLAQEVFVKAYFGIRTFEGRSEFRTWLHRIKINHCINFMRKHEGKEFVDIDAEQQPANAELAVSEDADTHAESLAQRRRIAAVLDAMPDSLRVPLLLRDLDGLSYQEIAETLRIGLSAVKMRIKRGREEFRERYATPERRFKPPATAATSDPPPPETGGES